MQSTFKHPQIFADLLTFSQLYYPLHANFPKSFRFAVGEKILSEISEALRLIVLANAVDKESYQGCRSGCLSIRKARASIEVIRGFILMAWKLKNLSHGALGELTPRLETISKQASRWESWFIERMHITAQTSTANQAA